MKVAVGAARGLSFLHDSDPQVIYRDFKASNILLDAVCLRIYLLLLICETSHTTLLETSMNSFFPPYDHQFSNALPLIISDSLDAGI